MVWVLTFGFHEIYFTTTFLYSMFRTYRTPEAPVSVL